MSSSTAPKAQVKSSMMCLNKQKTPQTTGPKHASMQALGNGLKTTFAGPVQGSYLFKFHTMETWKKGVEGHFVQKHGAILKASCTM